MFSANSLTAKLEEASNILILLIVLTAILVVIPTGYFIFSLIKFKKMKSEAKHYNKSLFIGLLFNSLFSIAFTIMGYLCFFYGIIGLKDESLAKTLTITSIVLGYVSSICSFVILMFFGQYLAVAFSEGKIVTLLDTIKYEKITKIIDDKDKGAIFVNYMVGSSSNKKIKFAKSLVIGHFIIANAELTGIKVEEGNQFEYFKEKVQAQKMSAMKETDYKKKVISKEKTKEKTDIDSKKEDKSE